MTHRQTGLFSSTSTYNSTDLLTARGVAHLVVHGTSDSTRYETIPPVRLESSGGVLSTVDMVVQQRDDPRRLRDHDDDDGSSTGGGSTSVRGRIRSPHIYGGRLVAGSQRAYGPRLGQTDGQTDGRIAVSLNARLRRGIIIIVLYRRINSQKVGLVHKKINSLGMTDILITPSLFSFTKL